MKKNLLMLPALAFCLVAGKLEAQIASYSDWAATYLFDHPDQSAPADDPGGFGVSNFTRYAFALDPLAPTDSPVRQVHVAEGGIFSLSFYRYEGIGDVEYTIETTEDLTAEFWTPMALEDLNPVISSLGDGREEVVVAGTQEGVNRGFFRIRANLGEGSDGVLFYEDFESFAIGETPSGEWITHIPAYASIFVDGEIGSRYLTMTDPNAAGGSVASLVRTFDMQGAESVSVTFEWYRKTSAGYNNHLGEELRVPALQLLRDMDAPPAIFTPNIVAQFVFRSWNRGDVWLLNPSNDLLSSPVASSDFNHNDPLKMRMTYRRAGEVIVEVSKDDFATVEWVISRPTIPNLNVNALAIRSSNRVHGTTRYADPVWEVRSVMATTGE